MTEWRRLTDTEVVDLATRLQSFDWSWQIADVPALATAFGWKVLATEPGWVMLDDGFGIASGVVDGKDGNVVNIELRVTTYADDDARGSEQVRDAFAGMATALTSVLGDPAYRQPGELAELRWIGSEATFRLLLASGSVRLHLITNAALAVRDSTIESEEGKLS